MSFSPVDRARLTAVLAVAVLGISSSAVLVRLMDAAPVAIAAWRCLFAAILLAPGLRGVMISGRDLRWIALSGLFLGWHFATWFASLDHTTVLRSTVLVAMVPVWTGLLEWWVTGERPRWGFWTGIALALVGVGSMASEGGVASLRGDVYAAVAGVLWSVYLMVGRDVRQRVPITAYMCLVSLFASLTMWPVAWLTSTPVVGFDAMTWGLLVLATLGPQLLGHQGFSYAVKFLPASTIAAIMLLEPVGSTALAALCLDEWPPRMGLGGALAVIFGIGFALRTSVDDSAPQESP